MLRYQFNYQSNLVLLSRIDSVDGGIATWAAITPGSATFKHKMDTDIIKSPRLLPTPCPTEPCERNTEGGYVDYDSSIHLWWMVAKLGYAR